MEESFWKELRDLPFSAGRRPVLIGSFLFIVCVAFLDSVVHNDVSFGSLYLIPIILVGLHLGSWQTLLVCAVCTLLRETFYPSPWSPDFEARMATSLIAYCAAGLFARQVSINRAQSSRYLEEVREQVELRREAENQLRSLIETSPAAIFTVSTDGLIQLANHAAHELLQVPASSLIGSSIGDYLPMIRDLVEDEQTLPYRTVTHCRGRKADGESFLAGVWFSTYPSRTGNRLAAIVTDTSEDLREWQERSLENLMRSTRVLVGSVSHEIRNLCAAINVVQRNLGRIPGVAGSEDFAALATLAQGLARVATVELQSAGESEHEAVNLASVLDELRIIVEPSFSGDGMALRWEIQSGLPMVSGDHHGLLQVFLNLARNSRRVMKSSPHKELIIRTKVEPETVSVIFTDSGPGISHPERLFQPFQEGADVVGLGLFVSRAIVRGCGGELFHSPDSPGCTMIVQLHAAPSLEFDDAEQEITP